MNREIKNIRITDSMGKIIEAGKAIPDRGTRRFHGNLIQGAGQLLTGVGKDVVRGTNGYSKER